MTRLRWWLARKAAPQRIVAIPDKDGPYLLLVTGNTIAFVATKSLEVTFNNNLTPRSYGARKTFDPPKRTGTFQGTI